MIKLMVENGADLHQTKANDGFAAVHFAASNNDVHLLDYILETVSNPKRVANMQSKDGWSPSHLAGFLSNFDSLNLLIEHGAQLTDKNNNGQFYRFCLTTFDEIIRHDHAELLECVWLHAKVVKRDMNQRGSYGFVHLAAGQKGSKTLQFLLEKAKQSPNQVCNNHD